MVKELLSKVVDKKDLDYNEAKSAIYEIMSGDVSSSVIASFLTALATKGVTDEEIAGAADGMRAQATGFTTDYSVLDIVGTGGDKSNSFNISTTAAFVLANGGIKVAKHGNRAASSKCGTADCLEELGVKIDADTEKMKKSLDEVNICFMFAQKYHKAMKYVGPVRKELGIRTVFNVLGPLTNPANADKMVLGVFSPEYVTKIAKALVKMGVNNALVVYGTDCLDEISACAPTLVAEVRNGEIKEYAITPEDFGYKTVDKKELVGGTPQENAQITKNILSGKGTYAQVLATILNAGAGFYVADSTLTLTDAIKKAEQIVNTGTAISTLNNFISITNED